jgi:hypothetical protein
MTYWRIVTAVSLIIMLPWNSGDAGSKKLEARFTADLPADLPTGLSAGLLGGFVWRVW